MSSNSKRKYRQDPIISCCIAQCKNTVIMNTDKHFFRIPDKNKVEWCDALNRRETKGSLYICEDHLNLEEDLTNYQSWYTKNVRGRLKVQVPERLKNNFFKNTENTVTTNIPSTSIQNIKKGFVGPRVRSTSKAIQVCPKMITRSTSTRICRPQNTQQSIKIEVLSSDEQSSVTGSTTEFALSSADTGTSFSVKQNLVGRNFMLNHIYEKPFQYIGLPKEYFWIIEYLEKSCNIPSLHILITLYKIKNSDTFSRISDLFQISSTTLWRIFYKVIKILSLFFNQIIYWPADIDIKRNLPTTFRTNAEYSNIQGIIDCFEIEIEKPKDPIQQALTWSQYKHCNTIKYLISATPDGFINFVSSGYGGRISDINLVEQSGFLETISEKCYILADRGFKHLEYLVTRKSCKVLRPPSVAKDTKMTKTEVIQSKVLASLRVHIERIIRRLRLYRFLKPHSVVNNKLVSSLDEAVIIACGLINLQSPVIKKF